jgi:aspartate 1-decarboxylase
MLRQMAKSKIHGATVTMTELHYEGSITLPADLMELANILPGERVQIVNLANGERFETYTIAGECGSETICLNGPTARLAVVGDSVHIISYALYDDDEARALAVKTVRVDERNRPLRAGGRLPLQEA